MKALPNEKGIISRPAEPRNDASTEFWLHVQAAAWMRQGVFNEKLA